MGEYFTYKGKQLCKIGTCEHIMYARRSEVQDLAPYDSGGMCKGALDHAGSIYRFPWPQEDFNFPPSMNEIASAIDSREPFVTALLRVDKDFLQKVIGHNSMCISVKPRNYHGYNTNLSLPCPMSTEWNHISEHVSASGPGFTPCINIFGVGYNEAGEPRTVFECGYCGVLFSVGTAELDEIKNHPSNADKPVILARLRANTKCDVLTPDNQGFGT